MNTKIFKTVIPVFLLISLACFSGCKSTTDDPTVHTGIVGKWRWKETWDMIPLSETNPQTPENTGIRQTLEFTGDSVWYKTKNGVLIDSGTYTLGHGSITIADAYTYVYDSIAYYKNNIKLKINYYEIDSNNTLVFNDAFAGIYGGSSERWVRTK